MHVVADSYREVFIKSVERKERGITPKVYVKSVLSYVPREFQEFLKSGNNKSKLIELFFYYIIQKPAIFVVKRWFMYACNTFLCNRDDRFIK